MAADRQPCLRCAWLAWRRADVPRRTAAHPLYLCRDAATAGCAVVTGDTMFVGQAADQFRLFTGVEAPVELMRSVVLDSLKQ